MSAVLGAAVRGTLGAVAAGLAVGLGVASLTSDLLASALYEIEPTDPGTFLAVPALLLAVAALATVLPAWRAARVDPVTALREE